MLRETLSNEWFTIIIVICLSILAITKYLFPVRFLDFLATPGNSKYLKVYARDQKFIDLFDGLLYSNFSISLALFIFLVYNNHIKVIDFEIIFFLKIVFGVAALFLIKVLVERLIGSLFDIDSLVDSYLFQKTSYKNYLGVFLLPINLLLIFSLVLTEELFIIITTILVIINLVGFITSFKTHQKLIISNLFYFILYLCAFEIAPYIILFKVFMRS